MDVTDSSNANRKTIYSLLTSFIFTDRFLSKETRILRQDGRSPSLPSKWRTQIGACAKHSRIIVPCHHNPDLLSSYIRRENYRLISMTFFCIGTRSFCVHRYVLSRTTGSHDVGAFANAFHTLVHLHKGHI